MSSLLQQARDLRRRQTPAEALLWQLLRNRQLCGAKFRRQHQIGAYISDFYCDEARLVVECDGGYHRCQRQRNNDAIRDKLLNESGFTVLRFTNEQVLEATQSVLNAIAGHLAGLAAPRAAYAGRRDRD